MREVLTTLTSVMEPIARLKAFRQAVYENLCRANDATFELTDAVLLTRDRLLLGRFIPLASISPEM